MPRHTTPPTPDLVRDALSYIPANIPRDEWARVAMALKSEFPDDMGFALFDQWSQASADAYDPLSTISTWRSVKAGGRVGIGTLFHLAKAHGFSMPKDGQEAMPVDPSELARLAQHRAEKLAAEQAHSEAAQAAAATEAARQWDAASTEGASPYLARKGVQGHGVRYGPGGVLLVPLHDEAGKLWNLQRIAPAKPADGGPEKLFLRSGRKSGLWHMLGTLPAEPQTILIAEGYATAASLHEATGHPVAVAFDAGNLKPVALALRQQYPAARLLVCGDDDRETEAKSGHNPGRNKATAAARAVAGLAVFPEGLPPEGGSDFNDMHQHIGGAAGLAAVAATVQAAIDAVNTPHTPVQGPAPKASSRKVASQRANSAPGTDAGQAEYDQFAVNESGVYFFGTDREGRPAAHKRLCAELHVTALASDSDGNGWSRVVRFYDPNGRQKNYVIPGRMLAGDGKELMAVLLEMGLIAAPGPRVRALILEYITTRQPNAFATVTNKTGWHGGSYVTQSRIIGHDQIIFQSESLSADWLQVKGSLRSWQENIGVHCVGNDRMVFAVCVSLAAALLPFSGQSGGGWNCRGESSIGKTTLLCLAASVNGPPSTIENARATSNAVESVAARRNHSLLPIDELGQFQRNEVWQLIYMLGNGTAKGRASQSGLARSRLTWLILFLVTSELSLADIMAEAGERNRAGLDVRLVDIPADAGKGIGVFDTLHGFESGAAFAKHLNAAAASHHGAIGLAWLQWLVEHVDELKHRIQTTTTGLTAKFAPQASSGQVERVAERFALVAAAGEMATEAGLTGWPVGEAERAVRSCFGAWVQTRGGTGSGEIAAMLRQVRRFLEAHGEGRFTWWHRAADDHSAKTLHRAGYRRMLNEHGEPIRSNSDHAQDFGDRMPASAADKVTVEYFVLAETFRSEVCQGFDPASVARVLLDHNCLTPDKGRSYDCKARLPGMGLTRCYRIPAQIFEIDV